MSYFDFSMLKRLYGSSLFSVVGLEFGIRCYMHVYWVLIFIVAIEHGMDLYLQVLESGITRITGIDVGLHLLLISFVHTNLQNIILI